jgi:hypothetical protein
MALQCVDLGDPTRCHCAYELPCPYRATAEDMRCDICRQPDHGHMSNLEGTFVVPIVLEPDAY